MPKQVLLGRITFSLFLVDVWGKGSSGSLSTVIVVIGDVGTRLLVSAAFIDVLIDDDAMIFLQGFKQILFYH